MPIILKRLRFNGVARIQNTNLNSINIIRSVTINVFYSTIEVHFFDIETGARVGKRILDNMQDFLEHWHILDRRVLVEKTIKNEIVRF